MDPMDPVQDPQKHMDPMDPAGSAILVTANKHVTGSLTPALSNDSVSNKSF